MLALTLIRIGRSFGYDEGYTYHFFINGGSVRRALTTQVVFNNHPMFSTIQAAAWRVGLTGETPQRLGPAIAAAATVGLVAWFTSRRAGLIGGAAAGVALGLNAMYLDQARQLRGYALATLAVFGAALLVRRSWYDPRRRWLVAQGVCMVVAVTTHSYSAVTLAALAVGALVLGRVERRHLVTWGASAIVALAIMAPVLDDMRRNSEARGNRYLSSFPELLVRSLTEDRIWVAIAVVALGVVGAWAVASGDPRRALALGAAVGTLVLVVVVLWQVIQPFDLYPRFFISTMPFLAVLVGLGVGRLPVVASAVAALALVVALWPSASDRLDVVPTVRDAAAIADRARADGLFVCGSHAEPLWVYTAPMPLLSGLDGFGDCEVFITVLSVSPTVRDAIGDEFSGSRAIGGGIVVWADEAVLRQIVDAS